MRRYTPEEREYLAELVPGRSHRAIAGAFNERFEPITVDQVKSFINNNSLNTGRTGRFEKGSIPANKGTKNPGGHPGSRPTMFKPGTVPHNRKEIGSRYKRADGYWWTKIQDGHKNANWKQDHILLWEGHNGPLERDQVVLFANKDLDDIRLDNLVLADRSRVATLNKMGFDYYDRESLETALLAVRVMKAARRREMEL